MEKEILIDFLKWIVKKDFRYSRKFKLWQKQYVNETLFYSEYDLYLMYKKDIVESSETLCECGGNERVSLDCTIKPCKYKK